MPLTSHIKKQWDRSSNELTGSNAFWERSAMTLSLLRDIKKLLKHTKPHGRVLDVGAGKLPYRRIVKPYCDDYKSLDFKPTHPDLDYVGDAQNMPLPDNAFDNVICFEVLEHIPDPNQALKEINRVLKPGGTLYLSVPHLMYMHNEPHDYYRYTKHGLRVLLERAGFDIKHIEPSGGLFSFIQGIGATTGVGLTYKIPLLWPLFFEINRLLSHIAVWLDDHSDAEKLFALHFVAIARKR